MDDVYTKAKKKATYFMDKYQKALKDEWGSQKKKDE